MTAHYFDTKDKTWLPIPGRVTRVRFSAARPAPFPALTRPEHALIVHRRITITRLPGREWIVAHQRTSARIAARDTRAAAMREAMSVLWTQGEASFLTAVARSQALAGPYPTDQEATP